MRMKLFLFSYMCVLAYNDLMTGVQFVTDTYRYIDASNKVACGASYGGYMVCYFYWYLLVD